MACVITGVREILVTKKNANVEVVAEGEDVSFWQSDISLQAHLVVLRKSSQSVLVICRTCMSEFDISYFPWPCGPL